MHNSPHVTAFIALLVKAKPHLQLVLGNNNKVFFGLFLGLFIGQH